MEFTTNDIFDSLKSTLRMIDDEAKRNQIESYLDAAKPNVERAVFDLLSRFAETADNEVASHYHVTLNYRPGMLDLQVRSREATEATDTAWSTAEGDVEKITLRIPGELKDMATEAANKAGLSTNSWFVRMLARSLRGSEPEPEPERRRGRHGKHGPSGRTGSKLSGWVGPDDA